MTFYVLIFISSFCSSWYKTLITSLTYKLGNKEIESDLNGFSIIPSFFQITSLLLNIFRTSNYDLIIINYIIILIYFYLDLLSHYIFIKQNVNLINNTFKKWKKMRKMKKFKIYYFLSIKYFDYFIGWIFNYLILISLFPVIFSKLNFNIDDNYKVLLIQGIIFGIINIIARRIFYLIKEMKFKFIFILNLLNMLIVILVIFNFNNDFLNYAFINYVVFILFAFLIAFSSFILQIKINNSLKNDKNKLINGELNTLIFYIGILLGSVYSNTLI